jgi:phage gp36-like protein
MSAYITPQYFIDAFGDDELTQLTTDDTDTDVFERAASDASSLVDGYLATRYTLPLANVPALVIGWTLDITRYRLWDERAPEQVQKRYDDTMAQLAQLAKGQLALPPDVAGVPATIGIEVGTFSAPRQFELNRRGEFDLPHADSAWHQSPFGGFRNEGDY